MIIKPIPFSAGNELPLDLGKFYNYNQDEGRNVEDKTGPIRVFLVATNDPDDDLPVAEPADDSLDVQAVYGADGNWNVKFTGDLLTAELCAALFTGVRAWAVVVRGDSIRQVRELVYEPVRYAQ